MKKLILLVIAFRVFSFTCVCLTWVGCIRKQPVNATSTTMSQTPEQIVRRFVEISASSKTGEDRKRLQDLCIGDLKRTFERMNEEAFQLIYLDSKIKLLDLKVLEQKIEGGNASVDYQVTIDNQQGTDPTRETNRREVELQKSQGQWFIVSIRTKGTDQIAYTQGMFF